MVHIAIVVAPVSGIVHSSMQLGADRYSYQANLAFALLSGFGLTWALRMRAAGRISALTARVIVGAGIVVFVAFAAGSWGYEETWSDSETL